MIQSMTGFGRATCDLAEKVVVIEIKTLNSKQLDLNLRIPTQYREKEMDLRNELVNRLKRGKVDVNVNVEYKEGRQAIQINAVNIMNYYRQLKALSDQMGISSTDSLLQAIIRLPDAVIAEKEIPDAEEWDKFQYAFTFAIGELEQFRNQEGKALAFDIMNRINLIETLLTQVEPFEKERENTIRTKLNSSLLDFIPQESLDKNRFEQELIYYLEKFDISEEKTRLKHHCQYFAEVMKEPDQVGRKLGFVAQEIGREINTIGSKANHSGIQKIVVMMKDELEKVKEQLMNIL
jgi:uncharacterized protein (TIGR00255 family)